MRKKVIAANWKMNLSYAEAMALTDALVDATSLQLNNNIILAAPFIYLHDLVGRIQSHPLFSVAAQNCSSEDKGAYTGEISASMLTSIGVEHVIIGHSERRAIFMEEDHVLARKTDRALENGLIPIFCCGENLNQRKEKKHFDVVEKQLNNGLFHVSEMNIAECIIAYEPVWAIGTGVNAQPAEAQEMHSFIREKIRSKYGEQIAGQISVLYGGSVSSKNAGELFECPDVDGGLVGGASLKAGEFLSIIQSMEKTFAR